MKLVFDFGKVVFDWEPRALLARLLPQHVPDAATAHAFEAHFFQDFRGDWGEFDRGVLDAEALADRIARRTGLSHRQVRSVIDAVPGELRPLPEMLALLERLHDAGNPLYFLSNMPLPYADAIDAAHPFLGRFTDGIYSARVGLIKPEPEIFAVAAQRFGAATAELLLIDDLPDNVDAARRAGWQALGFENVAQCEADLRRAGLCGPLTRLPRE